MSHLGLEKNFWQKPQEPLIAGEPAVTALVSSFSTWVGRQVKRWVSAKPREKSVQVEDTLTWIISEIQHMYWESPHFNMRRIKKYLGAYVSSSFYTQLAGYSLDWETAIQWGPRLDGRHVSRRESAMREYLLRTAEQIWPQRLQLLHQKLEDAGIVKWIPNIVGMLTSSFGTVREAWETPHTKMQSLRSLDAWIDTYRSTYGCSSVKHALDRGALIRQYLALLVIALADDTLFMENNSSKKQELLTWAHKTRAQDDLRQKGDGGHYPICLGEYANSLGSADIGRLHRQLAQDFHLPDLWTMGLRFIGSRFLIECR